MRRCSFGMLVSGQSGDLMKVLLTTQPRWSVATAPTQNS
jgi:hypothetical protein